MTMVTTHTGFTYKESDTVTTIGFNHFKWTADLVLRRLINHAAGCYIARVRYGNVDYRYNIDDCPIHEEHYYSFDPELNLEDCIEYVNSLEDKKSPIQKLIRNKKAFIQIGVLDSDGNFYVEWKKRGYAGAPEEYTNEVITLTRKNVITYGAKVKEFDVEKKSERYEKLYNKYSTKRQNKAV